MGALKKQRLSDLEDRAYVAMVSQEVSTKELAKVLGISPITAARTVAGLRQKGVRVVAVRDRQRWYYAIPDWKEWERARWARSRLKRMAGFAKGGRPEKLKPEDEATYGEN